MPYPFSILPQDAESQIQGNWSAPSFTFSCCMACIDMVQKVLIAFL